MRLLLRSTAPAKYSSRYRGTDRDEPMSFGSMHDPIFIRVSKIWDEYHDRKISHDPSPEELDDIKRFGWSPHIFTSLDDARWLVQAFRNHMEQDFEILEITRGKAEPELGGEFLGYDLSGAYNRSYLVDSLVWDFTETARPSIHGDEYNRSLALSLQVLVAKYFGPRLNANGLFDDFEEAAFCLRCRTAIPYVAPLAYEQEETELKESYYEVLGIYRVL